MKDHINNLDEEGFSLLHWNAREGNAETVQKLIDIAPPSLMGYIARKANVMKRCPKVKQNMRINMVLTIFDNIVRFKRNHKK